MSWVQSVVDKDKVVSVFVGDANTHHSVCLESVSPTDRHGRDAHDFYNLSGCEKLVHCPTHISSNRLDHVMTDAGCPWHSRCVRWYFTGNFWSLLCVCLLRDANHMLTMGYKLSHTTGLLHASPSCMQWGAWVWTIEHLVVLVQVIYCSKGGWVIFLKNQYIPERRSWITASVVSQIFLYLTSLPAVRGLAYSTFFPTQQNHTVRAGLWVLLVAVVTLPSQLQYPIILCIVLYCLRQYISCFLCLPEASVSGCGD